jgi:adenosine deaminase
LLSALVERDITLEICPTSNLRTGVVRDMEDFARIFARFHAFGVRYCINTDGPEMLHTDLIRERSLLVAHRLVTPLQLGDADRNARRATFIRTANA